MRNTAIQNLVKTYQQIKLKNLSSKIEDIQRKELVWAPLVNNGTYHDLITKPLSEMAEASSPLWFVKSIVTKVVECFLTPTLEEYQKAFRDVCQAPQLKSVFFQFFASAIR